MPKQESRTNSPGGRRTQGRLRVVALSSSDAQELADLRREQFLKSPSFRWTRPDALDWSATDEASLVLGVRNEEDLLVSTSRATPYPDPDAAQAGLQYSMALVPVAGRIVISGRSATRPGWRGLGLNALLRRVVYGQMDRIGAQAIVAVVYEGAPHLRRLAQCGYTFHPTSGHWDDEAEPMATPRIICLQRSDLRRAIDAADAEIAGLRAVIDMDEDAICAQASACALNLDAVAHHHAGFS